MAKPKVEVEVRGDTKPLERKIDKLSSKRVNLDLNSKNFSAPLGKIKGDLGEFDKSLAASNARVLAFGASAGAIFAIQKALSETVKATISVEKALAEVNVILGTSERKLAGFGNALFDIAKKTGSSFQDVAIAGGELARQGLNIEKTLKRTSDAMILARLSGLGVEASVNAITAALNGFRDAALDSTKVVDKLIAVDQAFAVSGADLAEALRRVGSTAEGAGVSLDELLGIVTAAQQITARGGAVIGNSFKTIFTRIQRPKVLEALDALGVKTKNAAGASLSATKILKNLATTFDTLGEAQQAQIAELVGGVFQINVLKAALSDLGSSYSVFTNATNIAANASGESARRNAELNKTLSAGLNETLQNVTKLAVGVGKLTLEPAIKNVLSLVNAITNKLSSGDSEEAGESIGKSLLGGIGKFLAGPGLAMAAVVLFQLFNNLRKFAVDAVRTFSGLNTTFKQQQQLQQGIVNILQQNPKILAQIQRGEISVDQAAKQILGSYKNLNSELVSMNAVAQQLAANMQKAGASVGTVKGRSTIKTGGKAATGYVPNFADQGEVAAMALSGMYTKSQIANPRTRRGKVHDGQGGSFMTTYNGHETKKDVIGPNGKKGTIIASPAMQKALAHGYVPNFGFQSLKPILGTKANLNVNNDKLRAWLQNNPGVGAATHLQGQATYKEALAQNKISAANQKTLKRSSKYGTTLAPAHMKGMYGVLAANAPQGIRYGSVHATSAAQIRKMVPSLDPQTATLGAKMGGLKVLGLQNFGVNKSPEMGTSFDNIVEEELEKPFVNIVKKLGGGSLNTKDIPSPIGRMTQLAKQDKSGWPQLVGRVFESVITGMLGGNASSFSDKDVNPTWDYQSGNFAVSGSQQKLYSALFGNALPKLQRAGSFTDAKRSPLGGGGNYTENSVMSKLGNSQGAQDELRRPFAKILAQKTKAWGYVPNFVDPLAAAINRENSSNVTKSAIRVSQGHQFASKRNPQGFAVTNTRDEPRGIKDVLSARGYVPNFADFSVPGGGAGFGPTIKPPTNFAGTPMTIDTSKAQGGIDKMGDKAKQAGAGMEKLFGAMMIASLVTNTMSAATENASEGSKSFANAMNAGVNGIMILVATMTMVTGPFGMLLGAVGGLTAAMISYSGSLQTAPASYKKVATALDATSVRLKEQGDAIQGAQQALSAYTDSLKQGDAGDIIAAQEKYRDALLELEPKLRNQIMAETDDKKKQAKLGEAAGKNSKALAAASKALAAQKDTIKAINKTAKETSMKKYLTLGAGMIAGLLAVKAMMAIQGTQAKATAMLTAAKDKVYASAAAAYHRVNTLLIVAAIEKNTAATVATNIKSAGAGAGMAALLGPIGILVIIAAGIFAWLKGGEYGEALQTIEDEIKKNTSKYVDDPGSGTTRSERGDRQMKGDAQDLLNLLEGSPKFNAMTDDQKTAALNKVRGAVNKGGTNEEREKILIAELAKLGVAADTAAGFVNGAGSNTYQLAMEMMLLSKLTAKQRAEFDRLKAILDANAAAAAAVAGQIKKTNEALNAMTNMGVILDSAFRDSVAAAKQFNRDFMMAQLKGGAKLAKQFSSAIAITDRDDQVKRAGIKEQFGKSSREIQRTGSQDMFDAVMEQGPLKALVEKVEAGGTDVTPAMQSLVGSLKRTGANFDSGGAGGMMEELKRVIASQPAGAGSFLDDIKKAGMGGLGLEKILAEQMSAMKKAEATREEQLKMAKLQKDLAVAQNKIDQQKKAGGGIKSFLDPKRMDTMEDNFNRSVDDYVTARGRGDSVKTGQASGNLLGNLNEFVGADMMGPAADKLKDKVQTGLAQSLKGRAFARADVLDQAASETGDTELADLANTLRSQNFAEIAATQTALEFKRQKMPANIEAMLGVQQTLTNLQKDDLTANRNTAANTKRMADVLTGGGFSQVLNPQSGGVLGAGPLGPLAGGGMYDQMSDANDSNKAAQKFLDATKKRREAEAKLAGLANPNNKGKKPETRAEAKARLVEIETALAELAQIIQEQRGAYAGLDADTKNNPDLARFRGDPARAVVKGDSTNIQLAEDRINELRAIFNSLRTELKKKLMAALDVNPANYTPEQRQLVADYTAAGNSPAAFDAANPAPMMSPLVFGSPDPSSNVAQPPEAAGAVAPVPVQEKRSYGTASADGNIMDGLLTGPRVKASNLNAPLDQEPPQWVATLTSFLNTTAEKMQKPDAVAAAQGELMATAPIQITVTDADGTVKDIQNIKTRIALVEKNQSASTAGAPPLV